MTQNKYEYYRNSREDVRQQIKGHFNRSLDIGCGAGHVSIALKKDGIVNHIEGIELSSEVADLAEKNLEKIYRIDLSKPDSIMPSQSYDLILCLDVLEHMNDPWNALKKIRLLMHKNSTLIVSIPNICNYRVIFPLLLKNEWKYEDSGILDRTHLRFFTQKTAIQMLEQAGFKITNISSPTFQKKGKAWFLNAISLGLFKNLLAYQYFIFARLD